MFYSCRPNGFEKLDAFETGYLCASIVVVGETGATVVAVTYLADAANVRDSDRPSDEYLQRILCGGRQRGLSESYLREVENLANLLRPVAK